MQREGYRRHLDEHDDHGLTYEDEYNEDGLAELFDNSNEEQDFSIPRLQEHWYREVYDGDAVKVKVRRSWKRGRVVQVSSSWSVDGSETQTATVEYEGGLSRKRLAKVNTQSNMIKLLYGCFVVNESKVGESSGLPYHRTKDTDDKDRLVAPWGSLVQGIDQGDGWVRAENGYLPEKIGSRRVLHFRGWLEANDCSRWEKTKADAEEVRAKKTENTKKTVSKTVPTFSEVSVLDGKSHL